MKPQIITKAELIAANQKAVEEGTLAALAGKVECQYFYDDSDCHCAIGTILKPITLKKIAKEKLQSCTVNGLEGRILSFPSLEDFMFARHLQQAHDYWISPSDVNTRAHYRSTYFRMIEMKDPGEDSETSSHN